MILEREGDSRQQQDAGQESLTSLQFFAQNFKFSLALPVTIETAKEEVAQIEALTVASVVGIILAKATVPKIYLSKIRVGYAGYL